MEQMINVLYVANRDILPKIVKKKIVMMFGVAKSVIMNTKGSVVKALENLEPLVRLGLQTKKKLKNTKRDFVVKALEDLEPLARLGFRPALR